MWIKIKRKLILSSEMCCMDGLHWLLDPWSGWVDHCQLNDQYKHISQQICRGLEAFSGLNLSHHSKWPSPVQPAASMKPFEWATSSHLADGLVRLIFALPCCATEGPNLTVAAPHPTHHHHHPYPHLKPASRTTTMTSEVSKPRVPENLKALPLLLPVPRLLVH